MAALLALCFWRFRERMKTVRRLSFCSLLGLHLYMKAPIWFLMGRISDVVGGGGWHRAYLVDQAVKGFWFWWLVGTRDTSDWMPTQLSDGAADLTNEFVVAAVRGGLLTLVVFVLLFVRCFGSLGGPWQKSAGWNQMPRSSSGLLAPPYSPMVNFFSVSYFDQIKEIWLLLLAVIAGVTSSVIDASPSLGDSQSEEMSRPTYPHQPDATAKSYPNSRPVC